jgi:hypothetical protein
MEIDTDYRPGIDVDLTYLERTWNEPRYGETPLQHFNRIHGVSE